MKSITLAEDGILQPWTYKTVYANPPFKKDQVWVDKLLSEAQSKNFEVALMLLPLRPKKPWFTKLLTQSLVCGIASEGVQFLHPDSGDNAGASAPFDVCMFCVVGGQVTASDTLQHIQTSFATAFSTWTLVQALQSSKQ